jgi:hypothetical protein
MRYLKSKSTNYPDHGHHGDPPPTSKIPMVEPGIEPGTSWLVVRNSDHQTTRLVDYKLTIYKKRPQLLGSTLKSVVLLTNWHPEFVDPCLHLVLNCIIITFPYYDLYLDYHAGCL